MKKWMRMLGILLCMALICGAAGEEITSTEALVGTAEPAAQTEAPSPENAAPNTSETPVTETSSEPDTEVSAEPTSETSAEPTWEATAEVTAEPTPEPTPEPVVIAPAQEKLTLGIGEKRSVADWHFLSSGSGFDGPVEYVSSNRRVATVDANGVVKALRSGKAVITVRAAAASCTIQLEIKSAPKSVSLKLSRAELGAGESAGFSVALPKGRGGSWTVETSDPAIAAINGNTIVAVAPGTVKITVRTFNGKTNSQTLTVRPAPESVSFDRDSLTLGAGEKFTLKANLNSGSAGSIHYSAQGDCIQVDASGKITALKEGEATVIAETYNGKIASLPVKVYPAPTRLTLNTADGRKTFGVGETLQLRFETDSPVAGVTYKLNNRRAATLSADGTLTLKRTGKLTITATTYNGISTKLTLTIKSAPKSVSLKLSRAELGAGESAGFSVALPKGRSGSWTVESSDPAIAAVNGNTIVAAAPGTVKITVRTFNGKTNTQTLTVRPAPESVSFDRDSLTLGAGEKFTLKANLNSGSAGSIHYSAQGDCIQVDASGKITALKEGEATVIAETYNGKIASLPVKVYPAPTRLTLNTADGRKTFGVGETLQLRFETDSPVAGVTYKLSNRRAATLSADGTLTLKRTGKLTITATTYNGISTKLTLTIKRAPKSVSLKLSRNVLGVGQSAKLTGALSKGAAGGYELTVTGDAVRLEGDRIVAVAPGEAVVTLRTYNGHSAQVQVTVCPEPTYLKLSPEENRLAVGGSLRLGVEMDPGTMSEVRFESSNPAVAQIGEDGAIHGVSVGDVQITAVTANGFSASAVVHVLPAPERIALAALPELGVGERFQLIPEVFPENSVGNYTYSSSNSKVARIDANGVISCYATGKTTITVKCGACVVKRQLTVRKYSDLHSADAVAHRGASGYYPENTLEAFRHTKDYGVTQVELDVRKTADGQLVVFHDATIRIDGQSRRIDSLTYAELKAAKPDVCLLNEALAVIGECGLYAHVEIKDYSITSQVTECVKASGVSDKADYLCFDSTVLRNVSAIDPNARLTYIISSRDKLALVRKNPASLQGFTTISIQYKLITADIVREMHLQGKKVTAWTVDNPKDISRLRKMGVDCIVTNYPDRAAR